MQSRLYGVAPVATTRDRLALARWLAAWTDCIQRVDYAAARRLFTPDATGFGTRAAIAIGRAALERTQWRSVWPHIDDFRFDLRRRRCTVGPDRRLAAVWAPWTSTGYDPAGHRFARGGRATILLRLEGGGWRAYHTHFSLLPGTPDATRRPAKALTPARRGRRRTRSRRPGAPDGASPRPRAPR